MHFLANLVIIAPFVSGTVRELFPSIHEGTQDPRDVVPGCYGGHLRLESRQYFFDTVNFEWTLEVSGGLPDFETVNIFMRRTDPTGQYPVDEMTCGNQSVTVVRNVMSELIADMNIQESDCLREMAQVVMLENESKLARMQLMWMAGRYIFALNSMALLPKPQCEFLNVPYDPQTALTAITFPPGYTTTTDAPEELSAEEVDRRVTDFSKFITRLGLLDDN